MNDSADRKRTTPAGMGTAHDPDCKDADTVDCGYFASTEGGRKGEILDAAMDVFGERGYDGGSMREIASRVGVTEPALYRHFPSKEAIFLTMMRLGAGRLRNETLAMIGEIQPQTVREQMVDTLRDRRQAIRFFGPLARIILPAAARNDKFLAEYRELVVVPAMGAITSKAVEIDSALGVADADATRPGRVRALLSLMVGFIISSVVLGDEAEEDIVDAALRVMGWVQP